MMPADMNGIQDVIQKIADRNQYATTKETMFLDEIRADLLAIFERGEDFDRVGELEHQLETVEAHLASSNRRLVQIVDLLRPHVPFVSGDRRKPPNEWLTYTWDGFIRSFSISIEKPTSPPSAYAEVFASMNQRKKAPPPKPRVGPIRWLIRKILYGVNA